MKTITLIPLTEATAKAAGLKLNKAGITGINACAGALKPILEHEASLEAALKKLLSKGTAGLVTEDGVVKLVKFSAMKDCKKIILLALGCCGIFKIAEAMEHHNLDEKKRKKLKPAQLENLHLYERTEAKLRRYIGSANGKKTPPRKVTIVTITEYVTSRVAVIAATPAAQKTALEKVVKSIQGKIAQM